MGDEFLYSGSVLRREVHLHLSRVAALSPSLLLKFLEYFVRRRAKHIMYFLDLVNLVIPWEESKEREHLEEHAAHPPHIHFVVIVAISEQALRRAIPSGRDILLKGMKLDTVKG